MQDETPVYVVLSISDLKRMIEKIEKENPPNIQDHYVGIFKSVVVDDGREYQIRSYDLSH